MTMESLFLSVSSSNESHQRRDSDDYREMLVSEKSTTSLYLEKTSQSHWDHEDLARVKIRVMTSHTDSVNSCCFFNEDTQIVSASSDMSIKIWQLPQCMVIQDYPMVHTDKINQVRMTRDGNKLVSVGWDRKVIVKDTETSHNLMSGEHVGVVLSCDISNDQRTIVSGSDLDNVVKLWDLRSGQLIEQIDDLHSSTIMCCVFTPDDNRIVTASTDRTSKVWDMRSKINTLTLEGHTNPVASCCVSRDGYNVATASWDKTIHIWDVQTGAYRSGGPQALIGHDGSVNSCIYSKDNKKLVTAGYDKFVIVWDAVHYIEKLKLQGHTDWVEEVDISKNDKWIISASKDKTMRLWNLEGMEGLPYVKEINRRAIGLKILQCEECGKPFPLGQESVHNSASLCVFCRLQQNRTSKETIESS